MSKKTTESGEQMVSEDEEITRDIESRAAKREVLTDVSGGIP
jgi:hypothetical protein